MFQLPILKQTEMVFAQFIANAITGSGFSASFVQGIDNVVKETFPTVYVDATTDEEVVLQSANWRVNLQVQVVEMAGKTDKGSLLAGTIFGTFSYEGVENDLNNVSPNYYVYEVIPRKHINSDTGDAWRQEMSLDVICMLR